MYKRQALDWLLSLVEQKRLPALVKDQLYDRLQIYINWNLTGKGYNRSFIQWPVMKVHYYISDHKLIPVVLLKQKFSNETTLSKLAATGLISIARASLAFYYRETDPFTYADPASTMLVELGEGFQVVLFGMTKDRRFSLDSYIGFLALKNGIPVAYGGGWIFGHRCKIGVNISVSYTHLDVYKRQAPLKTEQGGQFTTHRGGCICIILIIKNLEHPFLPVLYSKGPVPAGFPAMMVPDQQLIRLRSRGQNDWLYIIPVSYTHLSSYR